MNQNEMAYSKLLAGCNAEKVKDFQRAANEYRAGLAHPTDDFDTSYFLNNNLGYSLLQLGEYPEAEKYCREAIAIDPHRYNAHKNLGLALQGQGRYVDAAISLQLASVMSNDTRSQKHLSELLSEHPEVRSSLKTYTIIDQKRRVIQGQSSMVH